MKKLLKLPAIIAVVIACTAFTGVLLWSVYLSGKFVVNLFTSSDSPVEQTLAQEAPTTQVQSEKPVQTNYERPETITAQTMLDETNRLRVINGERPLILDTRLNTSAQAKCDDMEKRNYWSHNTPDGQEPWIFFKGIDYINAGENLAKEYGSATGKADVQGNILTTESIYTDWIESPEHKENLLDNRFTATGFGICGFASGDFGTFMFVQHFIQN